MFAAELALHWAERGHEVVVFTADDPSSPAHARLRIVGGLPVAYNRSSLCARLASRLAFRTSAAVAIPWKARAHGEPDVLVSVGFSPPPLLLTTGRSTRRLRRVTWLFDLWPDVLLAHRPHSGVLRACEPTLRRLTATYLDRCDDVVAISSRMGDLVGKRVARARLHTIPLWAPAAAEAKEGHSPSQGGRPGKLVALYQGNLGLAYDFEPILGASRALAETGVSFVLSGEGAQRDRLIARINRDDLRNVELRPPAPPEQLARSLACGDVHLLPLRPGWDGLSFPSKLMASLAVGRPVIVLGAPTSEVAQLVRDAGCGITIPADGRALAVALRDLERDEPARAAMGRAARDLYTTRFAARWAFEAWDGLIAS